VLVDNNAVLEGALSVRSLRLENNNAIVLDSNDFGSGVTSCNP
jgi:hypothetical protein